MATFAVWTIAVAASFLNPATGVDLLAPIASVSTGTITGVIDAQGVAPVSSGGFAETSTRHARQARRVRIEIPDAHGDQYETIRAAIEAARGGAGLIEWRHPDDTNPTLWRLADPDFAPRRGALHHAPITLTLEEF